MDFRPETLTAIDAVQAALELAASQSGRSAVSSKGGRDLVTETDVAIEDAVRGLLAQSLGQRLVGEERGGEAPADGSAYWLMDPICGTRNFASGTTLYCVNLALIEGGAVTAAVVGDPSRNEVLVAERGAGVWALGGGSWSRMAASDESRTIIVEDGKSTGRRRDQAAAFTAAAIRADRWDFRSLGSTLSLPYVAAGRVSAYVVFYVTAVHSAAGSLLVAESGCTLTDVFGGPWSLESDSMLVAATPELHAELLALVREQ